MELEQMKAKNLPRLTADDVFEGLEPEDHPSLNEYLSSFAMPGQRGEGNIILGGITCISCDTVMDGACGSFEWGIAHGEGRCSHCGWPVRVYHFLKEEGPLEQFSLLLPYHPDVVEQRGDS